MRVMRRLAWSVAGAVLVAGVGTAATAEAGRQSGAGRWVYSDKWGVVGRNTLNSPSADLRDGPWGRLVPGRHAATQPPPYGRGSLGLIVDGSTSVQTADKIAYGNETDFAGTRLRDLRTVRYSIFTGMDSLTGVALPGIAFEVDPHLTGGSDYSTLVYLPDRSAAPSAPATPIPGAWQRYDAAAARSAWFATGTTGGTIGCTLAAPCTFAVLKSRLPAAVVTYGVQIQKGRDNDFVGAVDGLRLNNTIFDFEFQGVRSRRA